MPLDLERKIKAAGCVERIDPMNVPKGILCLHQIRYEFAKSFCIKKNVLDIACGAGFGSELLALVANQVSGVDRDETAVGYARRQYRRSNLAYLIGDAMTLPFRKSSFDTVVSFETIEHLSDIAQHLNEVRRVLKGGGRYVVSTPKTRKTTRKPKNPHHTVEFSAEDFRGLLQQHFSVVEIYGQIRVQGRIHYWLQRLDMLHLRRFAPYGWRHSLDRKLGTAPFEEMELTDQKIVKEDLRRANDMIAVCTW